MQLLAGSSMRLIHMVSPFIVHSRPMARTDDMTLFNQLAPAQQRYVCLGFRQLQSIIYCFLKRCFPYCVSRKSFPLCGLLVMRPEKSSCSSVYRKSNIKDVYMFINEDPESAVNNF